MFPEVLGNIVELMVDPFGNYLVQKLLDRCSEQQRLEVREAAGKWKSPGERRLGIESQPISD